MTRHMESWQGAVHRQGRMQLQQGQNATSARAECNFSKGKCNFSKSNKESFRHEKEWQQVQPRMTKWKSPTWLNKRQTAIRDMTAGTAHPRRKRQGWNQSRLVNYDKLPNNS